MNQKNETNETASNTCRHCGLGIETHAATFCPHCDGQTVLGERMQRPRRKENDMNTKNVPDDGTGYKKKIWKILAFKRSIPSPITTVDEHGTRQVLTASYICREELGDLVLAPGSSNDEIVERRLRELADLRDLDLRLEFVFADEYGIDVVEVAIHAEVEDVGTVRAYSSICPFCDHEIAYSGTVTPSTRTTPGDLEIEDPGDPCSHLQYVGDGDGGEDTFYIGTLLELGRPADLKINSVEGGPR